MSVSRRKDQSGTEPVVLRLSDFCRDPGLSPVSPATSCEDAAGGRSRSRAVSAVSDYAAQLSPQILPRHHRADRLPAAQGAIAQCAGPCGMASCTARPAFLADTRTAMCCQRCAVCRPCGGRCLVGLSLLVAGTAVDL